MKYHVYVVEDKVMQQFSPPYCAVNEGVAKREFRGMMQNVHKYDQENYRLWHIGFYESDKGELKCHRMEAVDTAMVQYDLQMGEKANA